VEVVRRCAFGVSFVHIVKVAHLAMAIPTLKLPHAIMVRVEENP
jgi:hypothetical protein